MKTVKYLTLAMACLLPGVATAYSLGVAVSDTASQINFSGNHHTHVLSGGVNLYQSGIVRARSRYFNFQEGLGYTADLILDKDFWVATAGVMYNWSVTEKLRISPMLTAGYNPYRDATVISGEAGTGIMQPGIFISYQTGNSRWFANPKSTYFYQDKTWVNQVEMGVDFGFGEAVSVGLKVDFTDASQLTADGSTTSWLRANYKF